MEPPRGLQRVPEAHASLRTTAAESIGMDSLSSTLPENTGHYRSTRFGYTNDPSQQQNVKSSDGINNPPQFSGERDELTFEVWMNHLTLKLGCCSFRNHYSALKWICLFLAGQPFKIASSRIPFHFISAHEVTNPFKTADELLDLLHSLYHTRDRGGKALAALESLKQGNKEPFNDFFSTYLAHSWALGFSDDH